MDIYHPSRVVLFGSYARGKARADSDVDLLVVMPFLGNSVLKAAEIVRTLKPRFSVDLIVKTPAQLRRRLAAHDFFLQSAVRHGKTLHEEADA